MNVSSVVSKPSYTDKGNQYNKFSGGKKVGAVLASAAGLAVSKKIGLFSTDIFEAFRESTIARKASYIGIVAGIVSTCAVFGVGLGTIVDAIVNKVRSSKADNAQTQEPQANNTQVQETKE